MNCWRSGKRPSSWKICCAPRCRPTLPWPPNTSASSSVSCSCAATGLCCTSASVAGSLGGSVPWAFLAHRYNLRPPARRPAHRGSHSPPCASSNTFPQAGPLAGPAFIFPSFFASCGPNVPFWRHEHRKAPAFATQEWPQPQTPSSFPGRSIIRQASSPPCQTGMPAKKAHKKGLWRHHRPFIIFRSYGSGYCPNAFSRASSSVPAV